MDGATFAIFKVMSTTWFINCRSSCCCYSSCSSCCAAAASASASASPFSPSGSFLRSSASTERKMLAVASHFVQAAGGTGVHVGQGKLLTCAHGKSHPDTYVCMYTHALSRPASTAAARR